MALVGTFAMVGGALRGFNLLLILAGLAVGTLLMHWRWSRRSTEELSLIRGLPSEAIAGKPFRIRYQIKNRSRWFPVWLLRIEDTISSIAFGEDQRNFSRSLTSGVGVLPAGGSDTVSLDCVIDRRGAYVFGPARMVSSFPFSLLEGQKFDSTVQSLYVYPKLLKLRPGWRNQFSSERVHSAASVRRSASGGGEFFGIRGWQSGDSTKWIHWRTSARTGSIAVRQFEQSRHLELCLVLDAFASPVQPSAQPNAQPSVQPAGPSPDVSLDLLTRLRNWGQRFAATPLPDPPDEDFERAVNLTATFLFQAQQFVSAHVVLAIASSTASATKVGRTRDVSAFSGNLMMQMLSETHACAVPKLDEALLKLSMIQNRPKRIVVVSTRSMKEAAQSDPDLVQTLPRLSQLSGLQWINVKSDDIQPFIIPETNGILETSGAS